MAAGLHALEKLLGHSVVMRGIRDQIQRIARSPVPVFILGETGTGKELCAAAIAELSGRSPFVPLNCAAIPEALAESELFGHERGAFTGAVRPHTGVIAQANRGVLFLDELPELPSPVQAKLLRTLESGEYRRVGSVITEWSEFRILAATSGDLDGIMASGRLRVDLLHRLGAVRVWMPPLRKRLDDIPLLTEQFLRRYLERAAFGPGSVSREANALLMQHDWPGNVRQLRNVLEASAAVAGDAVAIGMEHVLQFLPGPSNGQGPPDAMPTLAQARQDAEQRAIFEALGRVGGNREQAALLLHISQATLYRKLGRSCVRKSA